MTADELFKLRGAAYERAVKALVHRAGVGYNPLGGEADDVDVLDVFVRGTTEQRPAGRLRVFRHPSGSVTAVARSRGVSYPVAYRIISKGGSP